MRENMDKAIRSIHEMRKADHIDISLNREVGFKGICTGFEDYYFLHKALPEIDLDEVDCSTSIFGKRISAPLLISSMVGGIESAGIINTNLAIAAQRLGCAMGVGSQRCAIEDSRRKETFRVRDVAPDIPLFANIGAVQLNYGFDAEECMAAVEMIEADGLILHLNPLQEALQNDGNTRFSGILKKIETVCKSISVPVIVKEVCFGVSFDVARMLADAGVSAIDVAGAGGTSWSEVEKYRATSELKMNVAAAFSSWGIPTADSIVMVREAAPNIPVIASGGIRSGIDAAKALALGADACGIALPLLAAAMESAERAAGYLAEIIETIRISMFCAGAFNIEALRNGILIKNK
jgi:isopentenyl-diphosphate delta-isomerase